jgi:hypothetical protein
MLTGRRYRAALGLLSFVFGLGLSGCDDRLPGFANPPPYDAGDRAEDGAASDEDGG